MIEGSSHVYYQCTLTYLPRLSVLFQSKGFVSAYDHMFQFKGSSQPADGAAAKSTAKSTVFRGIPDNAARRAIHQHNAALREDSIRGSRSSYPGRLNTIYLGLNGLTHHVSRDFLERVFQRKKPYTHTFYVCKTIKSDPCVTPGLNRGDFSVLHVPRG
ncbi:hypothetical protein K491DRAFT_165068 [Lophiostoma macrostomum CBS 122681]|uniref:Uncharacterized protein n=1 Tax=Lophiostoma macrostomum CBS 122681 TaxID=1314788 RepID=A0A6A6TKU7_9PLEO|nr:hypothetical protein K491DRAFT_165068 [Lophiostoma macrostomum CBS 122681]